MRRPRRVLVLVAILAGISPAAGTEDPSIPPAVDQDRAVAVGLLLDSPRPLAVIDEGLRIADAFRARYGIDTGDRFRDREEAMRLVRERILDRLEFSDQEIAAAVASLGYSLEPARCASACENVRELAVLELKKRALRAAADGRSGPGRVASPPEAATATPQ